MSSCPYCGGEVLTTGDFNHQQWCLYDTWQRGVFAVDHGYTYINLLERIAAALETIADAKEAGDE